MKKPWGFRREDLSLFTRLCEQTAALISSARIASEFAGIAEGLVESSGGT